MKFRLLTSALSSLTDSRNGKLRPLSSNRNPGQYPGTGLLQPAMNGGVPCPEGQDHYSCGVYTCHFYFLDLKLPRGREMLNSPSPPSTGARKLSEGERGDRSERYDGSSFTHSLPQFCISSLVNRNGFQFRGLRISQEL